MGIQEIMSTLNNTSALAKLSLEQIEELKARLIAIILKSEDRLIM